MRKVLRMVKKDTVQFNLRAPRTLVNRLAEMSETFKRDGATQIAVEILTEYAELWVEAEQAKQDAIARQHAAMQRAIKTEMLRLPIKEADTERAATPKRGRK